MGWAVVLDFGFKSGLGLGRGLWAWAWDLGLALAFVRLWPDLVSQSVMAGHPFELALAHEL